MFNNTNTYAQRPADKTINLIPRYLAALSLVAMLNLSSRQRMLSQKLTKEVLLLAQSQTPEMKENYREVLRATVADWSRVHNGLQDGNEELYLPGKNSDKVVSQFAIPAKDLEKVLIYSLWASVALQQLSVLFKRTRINR